MICLYSRRDIRWLSHHRNRTKCFRELCARLCALFRADASSMTYAGGFITYFEFRITP